MQIEEQMFLITPSQTFVVASRNILRRFPSIIPQDIFSIARKNSINVCTRGIFMCRILTQIKIYSRYFF